MPVCVNKNPERVEIVLINVPPLAASAEKIAKQQMA